MLYESERLTKELKRDDLDKGLAAQFRAKRINCIYQFSKLLTTFNAIEWKIKKYKEQLEDGAETK